MLPLVQPVAHWQRLFIFGFCWIFTSVFQYFSISVFLYLHLHFVTCWLYCNLLLTGRDFSFLIFLHLRISVFRHFCISVFFVFVFVLWYLLPLVQPVAHWERLRIIRSPAFMCPLSSQLLPPDNSNSVDWYGSLLIFVFIILYFGICIHAFLYFCACICPLPSQLLPPDNSNSVDWYGSIFCICIFVFQYLYSCIFVLLYLYLSSLLPAAPTRQLK